MGRVFLKPNNPLLRKVAEEIPISKISSSSIKEIVHEMLKIAYGEQKDNKKPIMVGLAAPQIGISKRIILVDVNANGKGGFGKIKVFINPEIVWSSKRKGEWYEGCYSIPEICGIVQRSLSIKVKAFTLQPRRLHAKVVEEKYTGYVARIFQHEIDHLDGKLFIDLIENPNHLHEVKPKEFPLYRNKEAWRNWPKKHPLPLAYNRLKKV